MKIKNVELKWLGHDGFLLESSSVIYIDPFQIKDDLPKADLILITHGHNDHCSVEDLRKIVRAGTRILVTADSLSKVAKLTESVDIEVIGSGNEISFDSVRISCVPAYNLSKDFHPKSEGYVGYILDFGDVKVYHAGDTDSIPEMKEFNIDEKEFVALLPVSGTYVMDSQEALSAVKLLNPDLVIPMHYGSIVGSLEDAEKFKSLCLTEGVKVEILEKEWNPRLIL